MAGWLGRGHALRQAECFNQAVGTQHEAFGGWSGGEFIMLKTRSTLGGVVALLMVAAVGGCAKDEPVVVQKEAVAPARWEAVVLPESTVRELGGPHEGYAWWDDRRDGEMSYRNNQPLLASGQWPEPARPSLDRPRYLVLPKKPETLLYFRSE
jgi:hypothetical protein